MKRRLFGVASGFALFLFCNSALATLVDLTDAGLVGSLSSISNGYRGTIDGIGFTLTSTDGTVSFREAYDGTARIGCLSDGGVLTCNKDGIGIGDDEVTGGTEVLTLTFDSVVNISAFYFLDLYVNPDGSGAREQATIDIDGNFFNTVNGTGLNGDGGYASLAVPVRGQTIRFSGNPDQAFWDDHNNDYALAGVNVSAVPLPAAAWLFGTAVAGVIGFGRSRRNGLAA